MHCGLLQSSFAGCGVPPILWLPVWVALGSHLVQSVAAGCRVCWIALWIGMAGMYFDDLTIQDVKSATGSSQNFWGQQMDPKSQVCNRSLLASLLGSPFSTEKHQARVQPQWVELLPFLCRSYMRLMLDASRAFKGKGSKREI